MRRAFLLKRALCGLCASVVGFLCAFALAAQSGSGGVNRAEHLDKPYVVLVSLDGFRADYLDRFRLPNLARIMKRGVRAKWMNPVFPTLTFPNHYSLVTGLHPQKHGIVSNSFYDPVRREKYVMHEDEVVTDGSWYRGEPIWVTAETQGMVAACYFWPGSEAAIKGVRPTFAMRYDEKVPNRARVRRALEWLQLPPEQRPHMITLYFSELDTASHRNRLESREIERAAQSLDSAIGSLLNGIDALPVAGQVNLVITSDHGMVETGRSRTITVESLVTLSGVEHTFDGAVTSFHIAGRETTRAAKLRDDLNARLQHGRAYLREELPQRFQYRDDPRAGDVIVLMGEPWMLRRAGLRTLRPGRWGMHGWDPALPSMRAIFLAMGPRIRAGAVIEPVDNVDVYPFMSELLGLRPAEGIDGRTGQISEMVRVPHPPVAPHTPVASGFSRKLPISPHAR